MEYMFSFIEPVGHQVNYAYGIDHHKRFNSDIRALYATHIECLKQRFGFL